MGFIVDERLALYTFAEGGVTATVTMTAFRVSLMMMGVPAKCSNYSHRRLILPNEVNRTLLQTG